MLHNVQQLNRLGGYLGASQFRTDMLYYQKWGQRLCNEGNVPVAKALDRGRIGLQLKSHRNTGGGDSFSLTCNCDCVTREGGTAAPFFVFRRERSIYVTTQPRNSKRANPSFVRLEVDAPVNRHQK